MKTSAISSLRTSSSGRTLQWGSELWGFHPSMFLWCLRPHVSSHHVHCEVVERGHGVVAHSSSSDEKLQKQLLSDQRGRFKDERACELVATRCVERFLKKVKNVERPRVLFTMPRRFVKYSDPVLFLRIANRAQDAGLWLSRTCSRMDCVCKLGDENLLHCTLRDKFPAAWPSPTSSSVHGKGDDACATPQQLQKAKRRALRPRGQLVKQLENLHDLQPRANYDDFVSLVHGIR